MTWPPRDGRSFVALIASIGGAIALTCFAVWMVWIFVWGFAWPVDTSVQRLDWLGWGLMILLGGSLLVLVTLGFAINRRSIRFGKDGFEASGGDDPAPVVTTTTTTAVSTEPAP